MIYGMTQATLTLAQEAEIAYREEAQEAHLAHQQQYERERLELARQARASLARLTTDTLALDAPLLDVDDPTDTWAMFAVTLDDLPTLTWRLAPDGDRGAWYAPATCDKCGSLTYSPPITRLAHLGRALVNRHEVGPHGCANPEAGRPPKPSKGVLRVDLDENTGLADLEAWIMGWDDVQIVPLYQREVLVVGSRREGF